MNCTFTPVVLAVLTLAPLLNAAPPAARLERDAPVAMRLKKALSSETPRTNDRVEFEVIEDVSAAGSVIIPKGSTAWGRVADAAPVGRLMRGGRLAVDIESVALADGRSVRLHAAAAGHTAQKKLRDTSSDSLGALPALPFTMFQYGKAIEIPAGRMVTAYTAAAVVLGSAAQPRDNPAGGLPAVPAGNVLPTLEGAVPAQIAPTPARAVQPGSPTVAAILPRLESTSAGLAAESATQASVPVREPVSVSRGSSKKLLTILAVGVGAGLAGVLAAKGHGGSQTAAAPGATAPTTVGIGPITVGGPH